MGYSPFPLKNLPYWIVSYGCFLFLFFLGISVRRKVRGKREIKFLITLLHTHIIEFDWFLGIFSAIYKFLHEGGSKKHDLVSISQRQCVSSANEVNLTFPLTLSHRFLLPVELNVCVCFF